MFDLCQTDFSIYSKLTVSPLFLEVIHRSTTFKLIKGYQRLKKNDTIQFDVSDLPFISFIPMSQTISVIKRSA